jgi:hypothetical protein
MRAVRAMAGGLPQSDHRNRSLFVLALIAATGYAATLNREDF